MQALLCIWTLGPEPAICCRRGPSRPASRASQPTNQKEAFMGVFSRFKDIVSANLNSILDRAEDPEKMVRLMIQEMEDTLIEVKSSCAAELASQKKQSRAMNAAREQETEWDAKARLAVDKGRDDLARAALAEKHRFTERCEQLVLSLQHTQQVVGQYQSDIAELEKKLVDARGKQRTIIQRVAVVRRHKETQERIRRIDTTEVFARFEAYENQIDRLQAEGDLVNGLRPKDDLRAQFADLEHSEAIERELQDLKKPAGRGAASAATEATATTQTDRQAG
jgi:phage shock protein A